jgi:hypothetical protein
MAEEASRSWRRALSACARCDKVSSRAERGLRGAAVPVASMLQVRREAHTDYTGV